MSVEYKRRQTPAWRAIVFAAGLLALVAVLMAVAVWRAPWWRALAAALTASVMTGPHVFGYDAAMLLLPVWLVSFHSTSKLSRSVAVMLAAPMIFFFSFLDPPWSAVPALGLLLFLAALARENRLAGSQRVHPA